MTLEQLVLEAGRTHRFIELCADNDHEVTLGGNGTNACEALGASAELFTLVELHATATLGPAKTAELRAQAYAAAEREYVDYYGDGDDED